LVNSEAEKETGIGGTDQSQHGSRIIYPTLPTTFTEGDLATLFKMSVDEKLWASTVARRGSSMVALLAQLKVFQHIARFLPFPELPSAGIFYVAQQLSLEMAPEFAIDRRMAYERGHLI